MAHADYSCCIICDSKMAYGSDQTKETACTECIDNMFNIGLNLSSQSRLIKHLKALPSKTVTLEFLHDIGYEPCYYDNAVDKYLQKIGLVTKKASDGKWGKRLRRLPSNTGVKQQ